MDAPALRRQRRLEPQEEGARVVGVRAEVQHVADLVVIARVAIVVDALADHIQLLKT